MSDTSLMEDAGTQQVKKPTPGQRYQFTPEELRCLKECNRESFYYRSLPISSMFCAGTYYAIRYGYLRANPRFGTLPKVLGAGVAGYIIGKFSYQSQCVEKIMQLPNSPLAEMLKKQKTNRGGTGFGGFGETLTLEPGFTTTGVSVPSPHDDSYSSSTNYSDVNDTRPLSDSYDTSEFGGSYRENELQMREDTLPQKPPLFTTSYDELRRQNREDFERKHHASSLQGVADTPLSSRGDNRGDSQSTPSSGTTKQWSQYPRDDPGKVNVYGDSWDEKSL